MKMMKVLELCFLALTSYCLVADALVPPNGKELKDIAGEVVRLLTQDLLNKQLPNVTDQVSLALKITEFQNPILNTNFQEATGITLALYGVSVKVAGTWSYVSSESRNKISGPLSASTKASVKLNIRLGSVGQLSIDCLTYTSEFLVSNDGTNSDLFYNMPASAFTQVKSNFINVVCQSARNTVNSSEVKGLFIKYLSG